MDPAFLRIPFDQWTTEPNRANFRWRASISRAELSFQQRLQCTIQVELDGNELEPRRNDGEIAIFSQVTDANGIRYQTHFAIELNRLDQDIRKANIQTAQRAFILPGSYELDVVLMDTRTREHFSSRVKYRVASPSSHLLEDAWTGLPPLEFIQESSSPDAWYLPDDSGRLHWLSDLETASQMAVLLNVSPSIPVPGTQATSSEGLPALLPTLKVISQSGSGGLRQRFELLDTARRRAVFHQEIKGVEQTLDWPALKASLQSANSASIDVHSLSDRHQAAQFLLGQVRRAIQNPEKPGIVVILTAPVVFEAGEDLTPISPEGLPRCRLFYVRYRDPPERSLESFEPSIQGRNRRNLDNNGPFGSRHGAPVINGLDQLAPLLKPLSPKVFDVQTPGEMTKVLAELRKALLGG